VLVGPPVGEVAEVVEHIFGVGVKDMRAILVHQNTILIVMVVSVASNVAALVNDEYFFIATGSQPFGQHAAGKTGPNDKIIEHSALVWNCGNGRTIEKESLRGAPHTAKIRLVSRPNRRQFHF